MRILVVDDDISLLEQLAKVLKKQRYIVVTAENGAKALDLLFESPFDAIILDLMMPKIDGLSMLLQIRQARIDTPTLILTAKGNIEEKVKGLDAGADDYLAKPFSLDELMARLRALLRRYGTQSEPVLQVSDLQLDPVTRQVTKAGKQIFLTPREFAILEFLLYNKNRVITRFSLAEHVWGDNFDPFSMSNFMDVHLKNLRQKIGDSNNEKIIKTLRGVGYIIEDK
jgi:DNA-binding response OmpR family regulator